MSDQDERAPFMAQLRAEVAGVDRKTLLAWGMMGVGMGLYMGLPGLVIGALGVVGIPWLMPRHRWEPPPALLLTPRRLLTVGAALGAGLVYDLASLWWGAPGHGGWLVTNVLFSLAASVGLGVGRIWARRAFVRRHGDQALASFSQMGRAADRRQVLGQKVRRLEGLAGRCETLRQRLEGAGEADRARALWAKEEGTRARVAEQEALRAAYDALIDRLRAAFDADALERDLLDDPSGSLPSSPGSGAGDDALRVEFEALEEAFETLDLRREADREIQAMLRRR